MKYAISIRRDGGEIRVRAGMDNGTLVLEVADDGPGFAREELKPGHGLDNLERRLDILFPGQGAMEIGPGSSVRLRIPATLKAGAAQ
jgi:signal transduction histidine kinase